jgi:hypothetical protein
LCGGQCDRIGAHGGVRRTDGHNRLIAATRQPREVAVAEQTPIPDDERPVVEIDPVAPGGEPLPDEERPVPDSGADAAPLPDDERPVPDDDELESR